MRLRHVWWIVLAFVTVSVLAQAEQCNPFVEEALQNMADNCSELDRNTACYGNNNVEAEFAASAETEEDFFTKPADISSLDILESLKTMPRDEETGEWGVALMRVQASLPNTLPGQAVTFVLLGDVTMQNAVDPSMIAEAAAPVDINTTLNVALRQQPVPDSESIALIPAGTTLPADAISEDGRWLRVAYNDLPGWVLRSYTDSVEMLLDLPIIGDAPVSSMQAFYLQTKPTGTDCSQTPDNSLLIQTPEGIEVDLTINGAQIRVGSTILLNSPEPDVMMLTVIDGGVEILPTDQNPQGIRLNKWQRSQTCMNMPDNPAPDCGWSPPQNILISELRTSTCGTENIQRLNYLIDLPCTDGEFNALIAAAQQRNNPPVSSPKPATTATPEPQIVGTDAIDKQLDNLCYPGGLWDDGRCDNTDISAWMWTAGWYLARYEDGRLTYDEIPAPYKPATPDPNYDASFNATWYCTGGVGNFAVEWFNAPYDTDYLVLEWYAGVFPPGAYNEITISAPEASDTQAFVSALLPSDITNGSLVSYPSGQRAFIEPFTTSAC